MRPLISNGGSGAGCGSTQYSSFVDGGQGYWEEMEDEDIKVIIVERQFQVVAAAGQEMEWQLVLEMLQK